MADLATLEVQIDTSQTVKARDAMGRFIKTTDQATASTKRYTQATNRMGKEVDFARKQLGQLAAGFTALQVARDAVNVFGQFEQNLATLRGVLGSTKEQMKALSDQAKILGATTRFSAAQAVEAQLALARAGQSQADVLASLPAVLNLAAGAQLGLGEAAELVSKTLAQFNLPAEEATRVVDVLIQTANRANTDVRKLGDAFSYGGVLAAQSGKTLEETAALIGVLGNAGIEASSAGTAVRGVIASLLKPTGEASAVLARLGKEIGSTGDAFDISSKSFAEVLDNLQKAGASQQDLVTIFSRLQVSGASVGVTSVESLRALVKEAENAEGAGQKLADIMNDTLFGAFASLRSAVEALFISIGEGDGGFAGALRTVVDFVTLVVRSLAGMEDQVKGPFADAALTAANAIRALGVALGALTALKLGATLVGLAKGFFGVTGAVRGLTAAIAANPLGALAVAVGALAFALYELKDVTVEFGDTSATVGELVEATWDTAVSYISDLWDWLSENAVKAWEVIEDGIMRGIKFVVDLFDSGTSEVETTWRDVFSTIFDVYKTIWNKIIAIGKTVFDFYVRLFGRLGDILSALADFDTDDVAGSAERLGAAFVDAFNVVDIAGEIGDDFSKNWETDFLGRGLELAAEAGEAIGQRFSESLAAIQAEKAVEEATAGGGGSTKPVQKTLGDAKKGVKELDDSVKDAREELEKLEDSLRTSIELIGKTDREKERFKLLQQFAKLAKEAFPNSAAKAKEIVDRLTDLAELRFDKLDLQEKLDKAAEATTTIEERMADVKMRVAELGGAGGFTAAEQAAQQFREEIEATDGALAPVVDELVRLEESANSIQSVTDRVSEFRKEADEIVNSGFADFPRDVGSALEEMADKSKELEAIRLELERLRDAGEITEQRFQELSMAATTAFGDIESALPEQGFTSGLVDAADDISGAFTDAFSDIITSGENLSDKMQEIIDNLVESIKQTLLEAVILKPLEQTLSTGLQQLVGGLGQGGAPGQAGAQAAGAAASRAQAEATNAALTASAQSLTTSSAAVAGGGQALTTAAATVAPASANMNAAAGILVTAGNAFGGVVATLGTAAAGLASAAAALSAAASAQAVSGVASAAGSAFASGGVLTGPATFNMRNGMGIAGEAGPEAILPASRTGSGFAVGAELGGKRTNLSLGRLSNGNLGIKAYASGGMFDDGSEVLPQTADGNRQFPGTGPGRPNEVRSTKVIVHAKDVGSFNRSQQQIRRRLRQTTR